MRCYLVRHAQTAWNSENRIQGQSDLPLSAVGEQQAQCLAARFASRHLHTIVTSALQRSHQTAQRIALGNGHGLSPLIEHGLAEMHLGAWEGLTPEEIDARFQGAYRHWRLRPSAVAIQDAEPLDAFRARVRHAFGKVLASLEEGEHVVVAHGGVIAAVLAEILGADYDLLIRRLRLDNGGITALECGAGSPSCVLWINSTDHLASLPPSAQPTWF